MHIAASMWIVHPAAIHVQITKRCLCETKDPFPSQTYTLTRHNRCFLEYRCDRGECITSAYVLLEPIARCCAYPLRPKRTGQEVKASPQIADSSQASPLLRLAARSSNTSSLLQHSSSAASSHRDRLPGLPILRDDLSAHCSNREPYPVDKLLKFQS